MPFTFVRSTGCEPAAAGVDVLDQDGAGGGAVALPQLDARASPSLAVKNSVAVDVASGSGGYEPAAPGLMSLTRTVPAAVPSLFHSSSPSPASLAVKNSVPLTFVRFVGDGADGAGVDVLDQRRAGGGAVALPQLGAVRRRRWPRRRACRSRPSGQRGWTVGQPAS